MTFINIVIPTCNRSETLYWSLRSCLNQSYEYYRILVCDNNSSDNTLETVKSFASSKIDYIRNPYSSSMKDNWEFALSHITHGYVMYIGDDDGLAADSMKYLAELIRISNAKAVKLYPLTYLWPEFKNNFPDIISDYFNVPELSSYKSIVSDDIISQAFLSLDFFPYTWFLPSVYYGIVDFELIKGIKKHDSLFFNSIIPDIYSGLRVAASLDSYIFSFLPCVINATSSFSTGIALENTKTEDKFSKSVKERFSPNNQQLLHNILENEDYKLSSYTKTMCLAEAFLQAEKFVPEIIPSLDIKNIIRKIIYSDLKNSISSEQFYNIRDSVLKIAVINNLEDYTNQLLSEINFRIDDSGFPENYTVFRQISVENINNVFEASVLVDNSFNLSALHKQDDYIFKGNLKSLKRELLDNLYGLEAKSVFDFEQIPVNSEIFIKYNPEDQKLYSGLFVLMPEFSNFKPDIINYINDHVDILILKDENDLLNYQKSGIASEKILLKDKYPDKFLRDFQRLFLSINNPIRSTPYELALIQLNTGRYHQAIDNFYQLIANKQLNYDICINLAGCLEKLGDKKTAKYYYQAAKKFKKKSDA